MFDILTDILDGVRMHGMVLGRCDVSAPWGVRMPMGGKQPPPERFVPPDMPELLRKMGPPPPPGGGFYAITRGTCLLNVEGMDKPITLNQGDLVVLFQNRDHVLCDNLDSPTLCLFDLLNPDQVRMHQGFTIQGGGEICTFIHGIFFFENRHDNRLMSALPPLIHLQAGEDQQIPWLDDALRFLAYESRMQQPGGQSVINHLAQIIFIQAVRAYVHSLPASSSNWLQAMLDPEIGPALSCMHHRPDAPWTVASLASTVNMSRSAFAARFTDQVGQPPLQYLTHCRMNKAMEMLQDGTQAIKEIARKVGYESEAAFSNAFRRLNGTSPGSYRRKRRGKMACAQVETALETETESDQ